MADNRLNSKAWVHALHSRGILLLAALDQPWARARSWVPQLPLVRTFVFVIGKHPPDDYLETRDGTKCFFTLHKWWQHYYNFFLLQVKDSRGAERFPTSLCHYTLTLDVYYRVFLPIDRPTLPLSEAFWRISALHAKHFIFSSLYEEGAALPMEP